MNEVEAIIFGNQSHPTWGSDPTSQNIQRIAYGFQLIEILRSKLGDEQDIKGDIMGSVIGRPTYSNKMLYKYSNSELESDPNKIAQTLEKQKQLYSLLKSKAGAQGKQLDLSAIDLTYSDPSEKAGGLASDLYRNAKIQVNKSILQEQHASTLRQKVNQSAYEIERRALMLKASDLNAGISLGGYNPWTYDSPEKVLEKSTTALKEAKTAVQADLAYSDEERIRFTKEIDTALTIAKNDPSEGVKAVKNIPAKTVEILGNNKSFPTQLENLQARKELEARQAQSQTQNQQAIAGLGGEEAAPQKQSAPVQKQSAPPTTTGGSAQPKATTPAAVSKAAPKVTAPTTTAATTTPAVEKTLLPTPTEPTGRTLKLGLEGDDVKKLQAELGIDQTGKFDAKTEQAVKDYQAKSNLTADGVAGPKTIASINSKAATTPATQAGGANQNGGNGGGSPIGNTVGGKPIATNTGGQAGQGQPGNTQAGGGTGTGTGTGTNQPAPDKQKMSDAFQKVMDSMEKNDLKSQMLTGAGLIQDMVGLFAGLEGMNEDMTEYKPSQYLVDMVAHSKRLVEQGLPETEEEYMRNEAKRGLDLQMGVIKANAGGSGGAVLGNAFAASRDYYDAISKIDQADINAKMAAIPYHLTALEKMEQAHLQKYLDRRDMEIARTNAASKLVSSSLENAHKAVQYEQAFGKGSVNQVLAWSNLQKLANEEKMMEEGSTKMIETIAGGGVGIDPKGKSNVSTSNLVSNTGLPSNTAVNPVTPPVSTYATQNQSGGQY